MIQRKIPFFQIWLITGNNHFYLKNWPVTQPAKKHTKWQRVPNKCKLTLIPPNPLQQAHVSSSCYLWSWSPREARAARVHDGAFGQPPFPVQGRPASLNRPVPSRLGRKPVAARVPRHLVGKWTLCSQWAEDKMWTAGPGHPGSAWVFEQS